jgi:hypothetical protein
MIEETAGGRTLMQDVIRNSRLTASKTSKMQAARERELNCTKWFDYRFISPWEATELFVGAYQKEFRQLYSKNIDTEASEGKTGTRSRNWRSNPRELASFWNARQFVDELGLPYEFFIHYAANLLMRWGWKHIPRPNQLYCSKARDAIVEEVQAKWSEWRQAVFKFSPLPQYLVQNFSGLPAQIAHHDWLVGEIKLRYGSSSAICQACFVDHVLPTDRAIAEFGDERVAEARASIGGFLAVERSALGAGRATPSCFGVLHAHDPKADLCKSCKVHDSCLKLVDSVRSFVVQQAGSEDPISARRRRLQRERTRRCREKGHDLRISRNVIALTTR